MNSTAAMTKPNSATLRSQPAASLNMPTTIELHPKLSAFLVLDSAA